MYNKNISVNQNIQLVLLETNVTARNKKTKNATHQYAGTTLLKAFESFLEHSWTGFALKSITSRI